MDGFETCRKLKQSEATKEFRHLHHRAGETEHVVAGFKAGGVDYVVKPFEAAEVVSRVNTHLRLSRLRRELLEKNRALEARTAELIAEMEKRRQAESALQQADEKLAVISDMESSRWNLDGLVGGSPQMQKIVEDICGFTICQH